MNDTEGNIKPLILLTALQSAFCMITQDNSRNPYREDFINFTGNLISYIGEFFYDNTNANSFLISMYGLKSRHDIIEFDPELCIMTMNLRYGYDVDISVGYLRYLYDYCVHNCFAVEDSARPISYDNCLMKYLIPVKNNSENAD